MKLQNFFVPVIAVASLSLGGCATIVTGKTQEVGFDSSPAGAQVMLNGSERGVTPTKIILAKEEKGPVTIQKTGYKPVTVELKKTINGWFWGNIVVGGGFGSTTDGVTGAVKQFEPNSYFVTLEPIAGAPRKEGGVFLQPNDEAAIKQFILTSYQPISKDISTGQGVYMESLLRLLKVPVDQKPAAIVKLKGILIAHPDTVDFANNVLAAFRAVPPSVSSPATAAPVAPLPPPKK